MPTDPIGDEIAAVAAALTAAGVAATSDPATIWSLASAHDVAALIDRPIDLDLATVGGRLHFTMVVWLCSRGPDHAAEARLLPALPRTLRALRPQEPTQPNRWETDNGSLPAYRIESLRAVTL